MLSAEKNEAVAGEVTSLSLQGKVLAHTAMKQQCGGMLEYPSLLGTVKDRIDIGIFTTGLYQFDTGIFTPVSSLHVGAYVTAVANTAPYLQRSCFLNAMIVSMLVLSWSFLLPTFDKYLKIHNWKSKKLTLKLLFVHVSVSEQQVLSLINIDSLLPEVLLKSAT